LLILSSILYSGAFNSNITVFITFSNSEFLYLGKIKLFFQEQLCAMLMLCQNVSVNLFIYFI